MSLVADLRTTNRARGLVVKRNNFITATAWAGALTAVFAYRFGATPATLLIGFLAGLLYSNLFEYLLHKYPLHRIPGFLAEQHDRHHQSWGRPDEPLYVNFASNPLVVIMLFAVNAAPVALLEWLTGWGLAPGIMLGFLVYFILYEEFHWRMHMGGWLPRWTRPLRRHHMLHHAGGNDRFNVVLPLWDWVFRDLPR